MSVDASPSYALYAGTSPPVGAPIAIPEALGLGWFVTVPDYEGPLAAFTSGPQSGKATLDAVRAVRGLLSVWRELEPTDMINLEILSAKLRDDKKKCREAEVRSAMWGYSGGALASVWAAELQATYAPELQFSGIAVGGIPANVQNVMDLVNQGEFAGLIPSRLVGITKQYPGAFEQVVSEAAGRMPGHSIDLRSWRP